MEVVVHSKMKDRVQEALPADDNVNYYYQPKPRSMEPPVGHNTMLHLYHCPWECDLYSRYCLERFPGYRHDDIQIPADDGIEWGLEIVQARSFLLLWVFGLVILCASMLFGVLWSVFMHDIQGGFTVAGYMASIFACLFGTIQVMLDNF